MLKSFSSYLQEKLLSLVLSQQQGGTSVDDVSLQIGRLHILVAILQSLLTIIEHIKGLHHESIGMTECNTNSYSEIESMTIIDWKSVAIFVDFPSTDTTSHPLVEICEHLQVLLPLPSYSHLHCQHDV